jgi:hypothetical protein
VGRAYADQAGRARHELAGGTASRFRGPDPSVDCTRSRLCPSSSRRCSIPGSCAPEGRSRSASCRACRPASPKVITALYSLPDRYPWAPFANQSSCDTVARAGRDQQSLSCGGTSSGHQAQHLIAPELPSARRRCFTRPRIRDSRT